MSSKCVTLDEELFRLLEDKARSLGQTADELVVKLIEADQAWDNISFDQLLSPVRKGFEHLDHDELDKLFSDAKGRLSDTDQK